MTWPPHMRSVLGLLDNPLVACSCGRTVNADMLVDVRSLPPGIRGASEWLCDACRETLFREQKVTRAAFYAALGAPAAVLARVAQRDAVDA